jgi:trehalose 6-phosphate synthase
VDNRGETQASCVTLPEYATGADPRRTTTAHTEDETEESTVVVASNRQPYRHAHGEDGIVVDRPTGGLTAALDGILQQRPGEWVAWGDGDADRDVVDADDTVAVPPDAENQYSLRRVWLTDEQVANYYYGFSNKVLWPVCHAALTRVSDEPGYWEDYREVNRLFADTVADRATPGDTVFLQDYHLGLAPRFLSSALPDDVVVSQFWHIPWPSWDVFRACPHGRDLLRGLLGNDLLGLHVERYRQKFFDCVELGLPAATVDRGASEIHHADGVTRVETFPLGVEADRIAEQATAPDASDRLDAFRATYDVPADVRLAIGVDRLDYSKGIPQRLDALEHLFETHPEWRESLTFVQVGTESRSRIEAYDEEADDVAATARRVNERFATDDWRPVVYTTDHVDEATLSALYGASDVGVVSPVRDGMNLVAQEYVAAQADDPGVLVLSDQAGFHDVADDAPLSVTPQDTVGFAEQLHAALTMPGEERRDRMAALHGVVDDQTVETWVTDVLAAAESVRGGGDTGRV